MPPYTTYWDDLRSNLPPCWSQALGREFDKPYMQTLGAFLASEQATGKIVFPAKTLVFEALRRTHLASVKAVILGQDPYYKPGLATGLSFSVPRDVAVSKTLTNIYREMLSDIGVPPVQHGDLSSWADRGVLLLNALLTVETGLPKSHRGRGWETFTDRVIQAVDERSGHVAFVLWGDDAKKKASGIDAARHLIHVSPHPSPLGAYRGFWGSKPFSSVNEFLVSRGIEPIDWRLPQA